MPYAKPYRSYARRKPYRKRYNKNKSLAQKAYRLAKKAYKMPELKYNALTVAPGAIAYNAGYIQALDTLSQGTTNNTRVGNQIHPTSVYLRPDWNTIPVSSVNWRIIVFRWASEIPGVGAGTSAQVLQSATINSFKSEDLRYQSEILYDRSFYTESFNAGNLRLPNQIKIKLRKPIGYNDAATSSTRNGIYILILNNSAATTFSLSIDTRLYFRDP